MSNLPPALPADPFYPSGRFAKVPAEALRSLAHSGPTGMSHAEFRVFVALCRYRGANRVVFPTREQLQEKTGMTLSSISRATSGLQQKGWVTICYIDGNKRRKVENYDLLIPVPAEGERLGRGTKPGKGCAAVSESFDGPDWCSAYDIHAWPETTPPFLDNVAEESNFA